MTQPVSASPRPDAFPITAEQDAAMDEMVAINQATGQYDDPPRSDGREVEAVARIIEASLLRHGIHPAHVEGTLDDAIDAIEAMRAHAITQEEQSDAMDRMIAAVDETLARATKVDARLRHNIREAMRAAIKAMRAQPVEDEDEWIVVRCGHNWDICLAGRPSDKGRVVIATVFNERDARLIVAMRAHKGDE